MNMLYILNFFLLMGVLLSGEVFSKEYVVSTQYLEMKTAAGRSQPIYSVVEKGEQFTVIREKLEWLKIKSINGNEGWVSKPEFYRAIGIKYDVKKDYLASKWEFGIAGGKFGSEESYSFGAGYYFKPEALISIDMTKASGKYSSSTIGEAGFTFNFYRRYILSPFVNIASGFMLNKPRQVLVNAQSETQAIYSYGGGFNINPYGNMSIRFSIRNYYLSSNNENYYDWRIGVFGVFF